MVVESGEHLVSSVRAAFEFDGVVDQDSPLPVELAEDGGSDHSLHRRRLRNMRIHRFEYAGNERGISSIHLGTGLVLAELALLLGGHPERGARADGLDGLDHRDEARAVDGHYIRSDRAERFRVFRSELLIQLQDIILPSLSESESESV